VVTLAVGVAVACQSPSLDSVLELLLMELLSTVTWKLQLTEKVWLLTAGIYVVLLLHLDHTDGSCSLAPQNILTKTLCHRLVSGNVCLRKFGPSLKMMPYNSDSPTRNDSKRVEHPPNIAVRETCRVKHFTGSIHHSLPTSSVKGL
jgi:hypothetical protein